MEGILTVRIKRDTTEYKDRYEIKQYLDNRLIGVFNGDDIDIEKDIGCGFRITISAKYIPQTIRVVNYTFEVV